MGGIVIDLAITKEKEQGAQCLKTTLRYRSEIFGEIRLIHLLILPDLL